MNKILCTRMYNDVIRVKIDRQTSISLSWTQRYNKYDNMRHFLD